MPIVLNNNFTEDTHGIRAERLNAIQGNFASIQPELSAPANVATWAVDCYDVYSQLLAVSGVETGESEGATLDAVTKGDLMEEEYQNARILGNSLYADNPTKLKDFNFESAFPDNRNDKIARVDQVLNAHARHVADGVTPTIPASAITRLTDAKLAYVAALNVQDKERADARQAVADLKERFESDTKMLQTLRAWWYAMMGKYDERIDLIGMVNPKPGGGGGTVGIPQNFAYSLENTDFTWDAVANATSYQIEKSLDQVNWVEVYAGTEPIFDYTPSDAGFSYYRCRARNNSGFGDFSDIVTIEYYPVLPAPQNVSAVATGPTGTDIQITFDLVPTATSYWLYESAVPLGAPVGSFSFKGNHPGSPIIRSVTAGKRYYYKLNAANPIQQSADSSVVYVDVP